MEYILKIDTKELSGNVQECFKQIVTNKLTELISVFDQDCFKFKQLKTGMIFKKLNYDRTTGFSDIFYKIIDVDRNSMRFDYVQVTKFDITFDAEIVQDFKKYETSDIFEIPSDFLYLNGTDCINNTKFEFTKFE